MADVGEQRLNSYLILLSAFWKCEPGGDRRAPHRVAKASTRKPFFFRRETGLCIAAPQRRSRLFSPKCLRMLRFHKWQVDTDSPWCSPARWMKEDETSAVLFSKPWTHLFLMSVKVSLACFHFRCFSHVAVGTVTSCDVTRC